MSSRPVDDLVDPQFGLVTGLHPVERLPGMPSAYVGISGSVADSRVHGHWPSDRVSLGTTFADHERARIAAVGEAVERYCGNYVPQGLLRTSAEALARDGRPHWGPDELPFFAPWQYERPGFWFSRFTGDLEIAWARGERWGGEPLFDSLRRVPRPDAEVLLPASWVHLNWRTGERRSDPLLHHLNYAGIATGQGREDAARRGLLELVERDALSLWWHLGLPARGIDPASVPGLAGWMSDSRLELHLLALPAWYGVPVVAAVVRDPETGIVAGGYSATWAPADAAVKATLEAIHSWVYSHGLLEADGWVFDAVRAGVLASGLHLPHRPERDYLSVVGEQSAAVRDLGAQAQVWLDPEMQRRYLPRFTDPDEVVELDVLPTGTPERLHAALAEAGHEIVVCDLTTPDVAETPLRVVRVASRGLVPNAPAAFPYFGLPRWAEVSGRAVVPENLLLLPPPSL